MLSDHNLFFILPVERVFDNKEFLTQKMLEGWQLFLAEARKKFLVDELIIKNHLDTASLNGDIFEVDEGVSKLQLLLQRSGFRAKRVGLYQSLGEQNTNEAFGLGVSHNQLEHLPSLESVNQTLSFLKDQVSFGMVHQVHAVDDPGFDWDKSHQIRLTGDQWEEYFKDWALNHVSEGWVYLGSHRGASGRPRNFVLERYGSLPFYRHYEEQTIRKIISELTVANGISVGRIPLLLLSFAIAKDDPYFLSGLVGVVHALDGLDGYTARKGLGKSPGGPLADVLSDHLVESIILFQYAYEKGYIPTIVPWVSLVRNISTDLPRLYNAFKIGLGNPDAHPHEAFGTQGEEGRKERLLYGVTKAEADMIVPIVPSLGLYVSLARLGVSLYRTRSFWKSSPSQQFYGELLNKILKRRS